MSSLRKHSVSGRREEYVIKLKDYPPQRSGFRIKDETKPMILSAIEIIKIAGTSNEFKIVLLHQPKEEE